VRSGFVQSRASSWNNEHRSWGQRGGYNGYRVPEDRFRLYFGSNHFFRISSLPMLFVGGYPASSMTAIGLRSLIRGQKLGLQRGTKPMTYMLITLAMGTTYMAACTPVSGSRSLARFNKMERNNRALRA
jgi:hypothetical protein